MTETSLVKEFSESIVREMKINYRYQGAPAFGRAIFGTLKLATLPARRVNPPRVLECLTFNIIPEIGILWEQVLNLTLADFQPVVIIGDCSGRFHHSRSVHSQIIPVYNFSHGTKLDLFLRKACSAELVLICDDDFLIMDDTPLRWASERFAQDPDLAVVSLYPRPHIIPQLRDKVPEVMGSYCIIVRRDIWLRENLSFQIYKTADWKSFGNYFDTADYANLQLVERGYHIEIAPPEIRSGLITFFGSSMWGLKILSSGGDVNKIVNPSRPDEHKKAYRTALAISGMQQTLLNLGVTRPSFLLPQEVLAHAADEAALSLDEETASQVRRENQAKFDEINRLFDQGGLSPRKRT